jgi:hypothetical protein
MKYDNYIPWVYFFSGRFRHFIAKHNRKPAGVPFSKWVELALVKYYDQCETSQRF